MSLWRKSAGYALGRAFTSFLVFLLLPILTRLLTPEMFGTWQIMAFFAAVVMVMVQLGLDQALFRFYVIDSKNRGRYLAVTYLFVAFASIVMFLIVFILRNPLRTVLLSRMSSPNLVLLATLWGIVDAFFFTTTTVFQAEERVSTFVMCDVTRALLGYGMGLFALQAGYGIAGLVWAWIFSALAVLFLVFPLITKRVASPRPIALVLPMIGYGFPLAINMLIIKFFTFTDRWLIARLSGLSDVGSYSAGLKIAGIVQAALIPIRYAWLARMFNLYKEGRLKEKLPHFWRQISGFIGFVAVFVIIFAKEIFSLMIGPGYESGRFVIPILAAAFFIDALILVADAGIYVTGKTSLIPAYTFFAMLGNIFLCILWIPRFGVLGAAFAVFVSYALLFFMFWRAGQFLYHVDIPYVKVFSSVVAVILSMIVSAGEFALIVRLPIFVAISTALILVTGIERDATAFLKNTIRKRGKK